MGDKLMSYEELLAAILKIQQEMRPTTDEEVDMGKMASDAMRIGLENREIIYFLIQGIFDVAHQNLGYWKRRKLNKSVSKDFERHFITCHECRIILRRTPQILEKIISVQP